MIRTLTLTGSYLSIIISAVAILTGQFFLAVVLAVVGVLGISSEKKSAAQPTIDPDAPIPPVGDLKDFRTHHPELSMTEAIVALQAKYK